MLLSTAEVVDSPSPDRIIMLVDSLPKAQAYEMAVAAVAEARSKMPKMSGDSAKRLEPIYDEGVFGIYFPDNYVWFQDHGIRAFTMNSLQGKTIPMWIDDPTGQEKVKNPKAKTRVTESGKQQVLIFRKVAMKGTRVRKWVVDKKTGKRVLVDKPGSYPGAPGRINRRQIGGATDSSGNKIGGQIAAGNSGVKWRHPGLAPRLFLNNALTIVAQKSGVLPIRVYVTDASWKGRISA